MSAFTTERITTVPSVSEITTTDLYYPTDDEDDEDDEEDVTELPGGDSITSTTTEVDIYSFTNFPLFLIQFFFKLASNNNNNN